MRNGSLWSNVVFEKGVIFHEFDFETSELDEVSKSTCIWKHTTSCDKVFFFFNIISQLRRPLSSNFHRFVILWICWDTLSEKTGLWQLPIVSTVFNMIYDYLPLQNQKIYCDLIARRVYFSIHHKRSANVLNKTCSYFAPQYQPAFIELQRPLLSCSYTKVLRAPDHKTH